MQDIFIRVWQTRESLSAIRNFRTFLFVLSRNYAINEINKLIRKNNNEKKYLRQQTNTYTELSDTDPDPRFNLLEEAINSLSPQQKIAWTLSRREGLKYSEIATEMNISRDTVKKHIHTATIAIIDYIKTKSPILLMLVILSLIGK